MADYKITNISLADEMQAVIANLGSREWIQGTEIDGDAVCAHGAVKTCETLRPGDEHIIRAVMRRRGLTEGWNDADGRTKAEVLARMRQIEMSDADLAETFGPNWRQVIAVIRRAATLTVNEAKLLDAARNTGSPARRIAARNRSDDAARHSARDAARVATIDITCYIANDAENADVNSVAWWNGALWVARDAARVAVVADLVGKHGLAQDHIDTLMKPWIDVLGADWAKGN